MSTKSDIARTAAQSQGLLITEISITEQGCMVQTRGAGEFIEHVTLSCDDHLSVSDYMTPNMGKSWP